MNQTPPRRPRNWLDALVATALRWNDRLSRPVRSSGPAADAGSPSVGARRSVGIDSGDAPGRTLPRSR